MKLALAIFRYFPFGGLQRDMLAIAREALARGHQVTVFCGHWQGEIPAGLQVRVISARVLFNIAGVRSFVQAFADECKRDTFDLILGFNKMPGLDMYFAGDSCFAYKAFLERGWLYRLAARSRLYLHYENSVFGEASNTQVLSLVAQEQQRYARFYGTLPQRIIPVPPGISAEHIYCANRGAIGTQLRAALGLLAECKIILCLGSGFRTKGLDKSIAIFAQLVKHQPQQAFALVVIGADEPGAYRQLALRLGVGDQVIFAGALSPIGDYLAAADLLLHSARKELAGNALVEAMAAGLPVLATRVCGYAPLVEVYRLGAIFDFNESPLALAKKISDLLAVPKALWQAQAEEFRNLPNLFNRAAAVVDSLEAHAQGVKPRQIRLDDAAQCLVLRDEFIPAWQNRDVFALVQNLDGRLVRQMPDRQTRRFELDGHGYYCKWHSGVGWREIIKNLLQWRLPVLGANTEWRALNKLHALNIPSLMPVAYGEQKAGIASRQSFLVTRELTDVIQLDDFFNLRKPAVKLKRLIIAEVARITREMHGAGINHRDLYLCHFMLREKTLEQRLEQRLPPEIYLMDLHRAQLRNRVPRRWLVKDLGALYFSAVDAALTPRDIGKFLQVYTGKALAQQWPEQRALWRAIAKRAAAFRQRELKSSDEHR